MISFKDITAKNVKSFLIGSYRLAVDNMFGSAFKKFLGMPDHYKEQVIYRMQKCEDCLKVMACQHCGCSLPGKLYDTKSCNHGERFPDLMGKKEWKSFKEEKNISVKP